MTKVKKRSNRAALFEIIFGSDTPAGKAFDVALLIIICMSLMVVMLDSVKEIRITTHELLRKLEWTFTILFTIEYILRIYCHPHPRKYIFSFFGFVDLLSIIPTYLMLFLPGGQYLTVIRGLRLLRMFRILKMAEYTHQSGVLVMALRASKPKITVFLFAVLMLATILGSMVYLVEGGGDNSHFANIPISIYWSIVTITTVGFGDIVPQTVWGKIIASVAMITGYAVIAVPTGIISADIQEQVRLKKILAKDGLIPPSSYKLEVGSTPSFMHAKCPECGETWRVNDANFCHQCGDKLKRHLQT